MPRRIIKRYLPDHKTLRDHKNLQFLGSLLHDPNLLHLNRRSVTGAFVIGLFIAFIPLPFQMLLAALTAIVVRVNLPISVGLSWVTNPLTTPPMFYFAYKVGAWVMGTPELAFDFELSFQWVGDRLSLIWEPFLLGCFIVGGLSAIIGGTVIHYLWRFHVIQNWKRRKLRRQMTVGK